MGKQHGSLARAGKVKNQTPRVDCCLEKPKKPRGRALKRMKYNKRLTTNKPSPNANYELMN